MMQVNNEQTAQIVGARGCGAANPDNSLRAARLSLLDPPTIARHDQADKLRSLERKTAENRTALTEKRQLIHDLSSQLDKAELECRALEHKVLNLTDEASKRAGTVKSRLLKIIFREDQVLKKRRFNN